MISREGVGGGGGEGGLGKIVWVAVEWHLRGLFFGGSSHKLKLGNESFLGSLTVTQAVRDNLIPGLSMVRTVCAPFFHFIACGQRS